jgi:hypothetical protein
MLRLLAGVALAVPNGNKAPSKAITRAPSAS